ncbi:MAG: FtsW/RodA/SpoVE family cell cycle protein, partial [Firmicutes bacterium]|nr:FtsW/RodA/SpoVE family cell cycle protein [Bacillota bacterium]
QKQLIWFIIGALAALTIPLLLMLTPRFEKLEIVYLIVGYVFILLPFFLSTITNGALNWIEIGGYSLQPSEIVKFLLVFYLASVFRKKRTLPQLALPSLFSAGLVLILVMQRDLGGALIFFMTFMIMLYISSGSELLFLLGMGLAALGSVGAYQIFAHVRVRVESWQNPWLHADAGGYQILQSLFAIGTWGLWGSGLTRGMPNSIPVHESDFMFAALCEELGPLFAVGIIGVFIMIFYRGVHISLRCKRRYYSLIAAGLTSMLTFQTFLIIGGNIKLIPLTGVTLPFLSYGGSSVIVSMLMVGFLQWLYISTFHEEEPASEENRRERQEHPAGAGKPKAGRRKTKRNEGTEAKQGKRGDENE